MIPAYIDNNMFNDRANNLTEAERERLAMAFPDLFGDCVRFTTAETKHVAPAKKSRSLHIVPHMSIDVGPKPTRERKPRAAKETTDREVEVAASVLVYLKQNDGARPAAIGIDGVTKEERKAALKMLERQGKVRCEGKAGAARYFVCEPDDE